MSTLLRQKFEAMQEINDLEKTTIKLSIYHIFESNFDLEEIYYAILDYLEENRPELASLITPIEAFYHTSFNQS